MKFTHLNEAGTAYMVDVTEKQPTVRAATARGEVACSPDVLGALRDGTVPKGDVLAVARIAGISAAKKVPDLLPLAHTIGVHGCAVDLEILDDHVETTTGHVSICTMHLAKGLEFRAVAVMACDDEVIPLQERIETVGDDADLREVYDTERHLLYVACTRARDHLLVTSVSPPSEFLGDMKP